MRTSAHPGESGDIKSENVEDELVKLVEKHDVMDRLTFIGRTISEPTVRSRPLAAVPESHVAIVANNAEEFVKSQADENADWVYVRFLPSKMEVELARQEKKKIFIAGPTVGGNLPKNWQKAVDLGVDGILTDYPLELQGILRADKKR